LSKADSSDVSQSAQLGVESIFKTTIHLNYMQNISELLADENLRLHFEGQSVLCGNVRPISSEVRAKHTNLLFEQNAATLYVTSLKTE